MNAGAKTDMQFDVNGFEQIARKQPRRVSTCSLVGRKGNRRGAASAKPLLIRAALAPVCLALILFAPAMSAKQKKDGTEKASPIIFSPSAGIYATNISLELSAGAGSATIRYTLDGTEPDHSSPAYSAPILISGTTRVRAKAFSNGGADTPSAAAVYTMLDDDLLNFSSNLPLVIVNSFGTNIVHEKKIEGAIQFIDVGTQRTTFAGALDFSGRCRLNIRGRASLRYPKNSFSFKTIDGEGDTASVSILGFPAAADWVLYAPYPDKTFMRDVLAYELHAQMGHWAARTRFVEVFVNRTGTKLSLRDYAGVYVFEDRIQRDVNRVKIAKLKPDATTEPRITGGYIFKKDHIDQGNGPMGGEGGAGPQPQNTRSGFPTGPGGFPADPKGFLSPATVTRTYNSSSSRSSRTTRVVTNHLGFAATRIPLDVNRDQSFRDEYDFLKEESFKTTHTNEFYFVEPSHEEVTPVQKAWLKRHLNDFEAVLYGPDFRDPAKGYRAYIDPDSFIDYHLITETTKNVDGFRFSVFFHKDRGGKIKADPIWDWNLSFGNVNAKQGWMPEYWLWPQLDDKECTWFRRLFEDPDFGQRYVDRWSQLRTNVLATQRILARVDEMATLLQESQKRNFEKWPILGRGINPNYFIGATYEEEVTFMKKFIEGRLAWIEKQFLPPPKISIKSDARRQSAALSTTVGEIYFTLDGTDPRAVGGAISKAAQVFQRPLPLNPGAKLFARVHQENRWSGPMIWGE